MADLPWRENGCRIAHGYGAATLFWLVQSDLLPRGTKWICSLPGWLASRLAGQSPVTDPSLGCSWGAYNLFQQGWDAAILECLGLDRRLFPPVRPSGERLGGLASDIAQQVGLRKGIPVYNALGDQQASFLSSVAEPACSVLANIGTGGQIAWVSRGFEPATDRVETRPLLGDRMLRWALACAAARRTPGSTAQCATGWLTSGLRWTRRWPTSG